MRWCRAWFRVEHGERMQRKMTKVFDVDELREMFRRDVNLMQALRERQGEADNSAATILYSYDVQAGTYTEKARRPEMAEDLARRGAVLADVIRSLRPASLLDAGTGEGTMLAPMLAAMKEGDVPAEVWAFDLSLSRLLYARENLRVQGFEGARLFTGELAAIPLGTSSIDVVGTFHAIEPNRGREESILDELLRVARRYLVLVEPSYELGSEATREQIRNHAYAEGLPEILRARGVRVLRHERWPLNANPRNEAALLVAEKSGAAAEPAGEAEFQSPISGGPLVDRGSYYWSPRDGFAFPVIEGIPCLLRENGVLASGLT